MSSFLEDVPNLEVERKSRSKMLLALSIALGMLAIPMIAEGGIGMLSILLTILPASLAGYWASRGSAIVTLIDDTPVKLNFPRRKLRDAEELSAVFAARKSGQE